MLIAPAAASPGTAVLVRGSGFARGRPVVVRLNGRLVARTATNAFGNFVTAFAVPPGAVAGTATISSLAGGRRAVGQLRLLARGARLSSELSLSSGQRLAVSPVRAAPGRTVRLTAAGLPPRSRFRVLVAGRTAATGRTSAAGVLSRSVRVPAVALGRRPLVLRATRVTAPTQRPRAGQRPTRPTHRTVTLRSYLDVQPPGAGGPPSGPFTLVAAGDVACSFTQRRGTRVCRHDDTANLVARLNPHVIAVLGDNQYFSGTLPEFAYSFDSTWGRLKDRIRPAVGNHEYHIGASGYFQYYGSVAAPPGGYYSYDAGSWHVVVLNSNCAFVACAPGSAQERWLRADLAAHPARCTLAYFHHPRFASGATRPQVEVGPFWNALYEAGADLVLGGHYHHYERLAPVDPVGRRDPGRGLRQFVVGTGGFDQQPFRVIRGPSEVRNTGTFGVLELTLLAGSYRWRFLPAAGRRFGDSGSGRCH